MRRHSRHAGGRGDDGSGASRSDAAPAGAMRLNRPIALALLALLGLLAACGRAKDENATASNDVIVAPGDVANIGEAPNAAAPDAAEPPLDELAGVKVGMTVKDLNA